MALRALPRENAAQGRNKKKDRARRPPCNSRLSKQEAKAASRQVRKNRILSGEPVGRRPVKVDQGKHNEPGGDQERSRDADGQCKIEIPVMGMTNGGAQMLSPLIP